MIIGILSDTHGRTDRLSSVLSQFADAGVEAIVHCGDIGSTECIRELGTADAPTYLVAGNMDWGVFHIPKTAEKAGVNFSRDTVEVDLGDGRHLIATHGHHEDLLDDLIMGGQFPYVCHGHTHRLRDQRIGDVRIINPGALNHPRNPRHPTAAILDTETDALTILNIPT
jgi:uncharacterized protein